MYTLNQIVVRKNNADLKSSIKVLLSLFVMLEQDYEALLYYSDNIEEDSIDRTIVDLPSKHKTIDFAIIESLWFQIIIKSCSFLDEWDRFLGVKNEPEHNHRVKLIKKIVSPARKAINTWKDLKRFRNEVVAHNFRGKDYIVTIEKMGEYNCPRSIPEMYFLISFISRMVRVLASAYQKETNDIVNLSHSNIVSSANDNNEQLKFLNDKLIEVDEKISNEIFSIARHDIMMSIVKMNTDK